MSRFIGAGSEEEAKVGDSGERSEDSVEELEQQRIRIRVNFAESVQINYLDLIKETSSRSFHYVPVLIFYNRGRGRESKFELKGI